MSRLIIFATMCSSVFSWTQLAAAINRIWDDGSANKNWISANNWSPNGVPQNVDDVFIGSHANAPDDTVILGLFPPYTATVFSLQLSNGADLDTNNGRLVVIEDTTVGGGLAGGTLAELIVSPVEGMQVDAVSTNTLTIRDGGRLRMSGGSISVDGTGASEGILEIQDGGSFFGYGVINLDDDNAPDFTSMLLNDGTITVGDPDAIVIGEPPARTLQVNAPNDSNMGLMDLGGDDHDGQVVVSRNSTLEINVRQINQTAAGDITLYANSTLNLGNSFGVGNAPLNDTATLLVNSGETGGVISLPAAPAVITGNSLVLAPRGRVWLSQSDAELRIESEFTALNGSIINNGTIHLAGGARIEPDVTFSGNGEIVNDAASTLRLPDGVNADTHLVNDGVLELHSSLAGDVRIDSFEQTTTGVLGIQIGDILPGDYDVLTVDGNAELGGTLNVSLINNFEPILGNSFTILQNVFGNISGQFDVEVVPEFNGLTFDVVYNSNSVVLETVEATLPGDFNSSGAVENSDLTLLLNNWGAPVPPTPAGWTGIPLTSPAVDNDELTALLNNWGAMAGAGSTGSFADMVPEPPSVTTLGCLAIAVVAISRMGERQNNGS